jgi:peptidyl-prolyl cis-trans isomerase B (cyclophilin B)
LNKLLALLSALILFTSCGKEPAKLPEPLPVQEEASYTATEAARHNEKIPADKIGLHQLEPATAGDLAAKISTSQGDILVKLFEKQTPKTVAVFARLATAGILAGKTFNDVVEGYKIQADIPGAAFPEAEFSLELWNFRGAVALSDSGAGFMIVTAAYSLSPPEELKAISYPEKVAQKYADIGGAPHQDWKNTVFGQVFEGIEVADAISARQATPGVQPATPAIINSVEIYRI